MKIEINEDIIAWQKQRIWLFLFIKILTITQILASRINYNEHQYRVINNIAESFGWKTYNEFKQFLFIGEGSCGEVRSMYYLAKELIKISEYKFNFYFKLAKKYQEFSQGWWKYYYNSAARFGFERKSYKIE